MPATVTNIVMRVYGGGRVSLEEREVYAVLAKGESVSPEEFGQPGVFKLVGFEGVVAFRMKPPPIICQVFYEDPLGIERCLGFAFQAKVAFGNTYRRWGGKRHNFDREIN
ncbi:hypothetical protein [Sphingomonas psychrotolerans]|nr:hypothetical protein [Sphingomonas psychrotolerans]